MGKTGFPKRVFILILLSVYLSTNVAFASAVELNFWKERHENLSINLPSLRPLFSSPKWSDLQRNKSLNLTTPLRQLIDAVPLAYGNIQDVYDSGDTTKDP